MKGLELLDDLVCRTKELGADMAEVYLLRSRKLEVVFEKNDLQVPKGDTYEGVGIRVIGGGRQGFAATNVLSRVSPDDTIRAAIAISAASPADPHHWLPERAEVRPVEGIYDATGSDIKLEHALEQGKRLVEAARGFDPRVTVDSAFFTVQVAERFIANTKGIRLSEQSSVFGCGVIGFARDGNDISSLDSEYSYGCNLERLDPCAIGLRFAEKAVKSLGATTIPSFKGMVIISPHAGTELIAEPITFSVSAENVQNERSQWKGKLGLPVGSSLLSVTCDPTIPGGVSSTAFDREGVPPEPLEIITWGTLNHFLYNCYTARKDGRQSNGRAAGSDQNVPGIGATNLLVAQGGTPLEEMIQNLSKGLIVNRFSGNLDPVSGDFSGVVKGGYYIERGDVVKPVKEVMIAGNIYELLGRIVAVSREVMTLGDISLPYVQMDGCSITGR